MKTEKLIKKVEKADWYEPIEENLTIGGSPVTFAPPSDDARVRAQKILHDLVETRTRKEADEAMKKVFAEAWTKHNKTMDLTEMLNSFPPKSEGTVKGKFQWEVKGVPMSDVKGNKLKEE
jgi:hypothetical protein